MIPGLVPDPSGLSECGSQHPSVGIWRLRFLRGETVIHFDYLPITVIWAFIKYAQHCEASTFADGVHPYRVAGSDCHHRNTGRDAAPCIKQIQGQGAGNPVPQ